MLVVEDNPVNQLLALRLLQKQGHSTVAAGNGREALAALAPRLRDTSVDSLDRLAAATSDEVAAILAAFPLREMLTSSARFPVTVHRPRALYGSWY